MRDAGFAVTTLILGSVFTFSTGLTASAAHAAAAHHPHHTAAHITRVATHVVSHVTSVGVRKAAVRSSHHGKIPASKIYARAQHPVHAAGISCVPFARSDSGIELPGNAWQWWDNAAGVYQRGRVPQPGSVLAFRSNPQMRLGHVAVVTKVINRREIEVDHANWTRGRVSRDVPVVDVSEANDWSAVRVEVRSSGVFGSVYPTYGFIYDRADTGTMLAKAHMPAPQPVLNPAPRDLRPAAEQPWTTYEEVAEAPDQPHRTIVQPVLAQQLVNGRVGSLDRK